MALSTKYGGHFDMHDLERLMNITLMHRTMKEQNMM